MAAPIPLEKLLEKIADGEKALASSIYKKELLAYWNLIKITPEKWKDENMDVEQSFYVVAVNEHNVIWFNDIEEGFNESFYNDYGYIRDYDRNNHTLDQAIYHSYESVKQYKSRRKNGF